MLRRDIYNDKVIKYWYEEETSASMSATERMEYRDTTTVQSGVSVDDDGFATVGKGMEFDLDFRGMGSDLPGSSTDVVTIAPPGGKGGSGGKGKQGPRYKICWFLNCIVYAEWVRLR